MSVTFLLTNALFDDDLITFFLTNLDYIDNRSFLMIGTVKDLLIVAKFEAAPIAIISGFSFFYKANQFIMTPLLSFGF